MPTFTLTSRRVVLPQGLVPGFVTVRDGRIVAVGDRAPDGVPVDDLGDRVLMPALTDTHVHVNEPGRVEWEGFATATRAAAAGGATMIVDMPLNSLPVTTTVAALEQKRAAADGQLYVDVGLWGGVVPGNAGELAPMVERGALGFKCFLCHSGIDEFPKSEAADLRVAMPILRERGVPLLVHAELESDALRNPFADASPRAYARYLHSRPNAFEDRAVAMIVELVRETGCRAHIVHLSSADSLPILRRAKAEGLPITAETCPHYLGLVAEEIPDGATEYKCAPPIRERDNRERLWAGLLDRTIDFVVTDHSPCTAGLKRFDSGDFAEAWGGIASLQLGLRSVWTEAHRRGLDLHRVVHWMARRPADFVDRPDRGRITAGATADLVAFEPDVVAVVDRERLYHKNPVTPWHGRALRGRVDRVWLRGEVVVDDGVVVGPPRGRLVGASP